MFAQVTLQDWENLVKKQLKTEDIYSVPVSYTHLDVYKRQE